MNFIKQTSFFIYLTEISNLPLNKIFIPERSKRPESIVHIYIVKSSRFFYELVL